MSKNFDLGTVLSITSGRLFTDMGNIYEILNYLTTSSLWTHQLSQAQEIAKPYILAKFPELENVGSEVIINSKDDVIKFLDEQQKIYGNSFSIEPMPLDKYEHRDPLAELENMGKTIIPIITFENESKQKTKKLTFS